MKTVAKKVRTMAMSYYRRAIRAITSKLERRHPSPTTPQRRYSIPVDILRIIIDYLDRADLATICLLNKVCCSCAQDVLYRNMQFVCPKAYRTLSGSPHLARRVRLFSLATNNPTSMFNATPVIHVHKSLAKALRNMTRLRKLALFIGGDSNILDGCTFKLEAFSGDLTHSESFRKFLNGQPSLTSVDLLKRQNDFSDLEATCLPNLTQVTASFSSLAYLVPGRPVSEVISLGTAGSGSSDLSFFTLSTSPILKLAIDYICLYPKPADLLTSIFPFLTHLFIATETEITVSDEWLGNLLAALVSLRVFAFMFPSWPPPISWRHEQAHLRFVRKVTNRAPHLEYFAVSWEAHLHPWKRIDGEWVPCNRAEFPLHATEWDTGW